MRQKKITHSEARDVVDALTIMMRLRRELPYRGRGFLLLNAACHRLSERFWADVGIDAPTAPRSRGVA